MSNLFKSKFFLGTLVVAAMLVAVGGLTPNTASADCSITHTLKVGSGFHSEVKCLQTAVGVTADGSFGPKTKAAVIAWQKSVGLTADGVFGPKSRAAWMSASMGMTFPAGCTSAVGFSSTTGMPCNGTVTTMTFPAGCTSAVGFSPTTGASCATGAVMGNTGPLSVSLATDNPAAGNLIQGQATADLAHFMFTGTGTLTQVTLQRTGISDNSVFPNVYLYSGNTRLTDSASVNSQGWILFNGLNLAVNGSLDLSVRADITSSTTPVQSTVMVTLTSYTVAGGTAHAVNIAGNTMVINSGTGVLSTVAVGCNTAAGATGTQPTCTTNTTVNVSAGTTGYSLWSAPVSVSLHPVLLKSAAFNVVGSAPANAFANLGLYANGLKISTSTGVNSMGYIVFDLSNVTAMAPCATNMMGYCLMTGTTTLEVRGDIVNGSARTVQLSLQHASDLMVMDSQVGVNVGVVNQAGVANPVFTINQSGTINIQQGSLVAQSDATFNSQTNVTGGASNVAIASYKLTSYGEDVKVNTVTVTPVITGNPAACSALASGAVALNNVTLYFNGAPVGSSQNATSAGGCTLNALTFTPGSNLTVAGGTTGIFQVHADLINGVGTPQYSSGTVGATIVINQYQGISSGQTGTVTLTGSNAQTIQTGTLTVAPNAAFLGQTINPNTSGAHIGSFTLQNQSTSEAVQVNSLTVGLTDASNVALTTSSPLPLTDFSTLTLSGITGSAVTPIGQPTASNVFSTNFMIPAGGSVTVDVWATVGATNGQSFKTTLLPTAVGASSRVTITSTAVIGQTMTLGVGTLASPTLVTSQSTNAQFISTAGAGATNAAQETYNFVASTGTATITGLKFAALTGLNTTYTSGGTFTSVGSTGSFVVATGVTGGGFTVGDNVLITTTGIFGGTNGVGTVTAGDATHLTVNLTTPMVIGFTDSAQTIAGAVSKVYKLATSGATGVALNSPGIATGSATFNGGIAYLSAITGSAGSGIAVPNTPSGVTVPVFVSFGPVNTNGGVASGTTAQVLLEYVQYQTGSNTSYLAPSVAGTTLTLVGSKPNITLASSGTTPTAPTTDLLLGTVTVAADNTGDIFLHQIPLNVSINSGTSGTANITSVKLTDTNDVTLTGLSSGGTCTAAANSSTSACVQTWSSGNYYRVSQGGSKTFEVHVTTAGAFGTSASVSFGLGASSTFFWGDVNGGALATGGATPPNDLTGASLYSYPNASVSIHN